MGPMRLVGASVGSKEKIVFDISCFGVDENDVLSDDRYLVIHHQRRSPEGEIEALGPRGGDVVLKLAGGAEAAVEDVSVVGLGGGRREEAAHGVRSRRLRAAHGEPFHLRGLRIGRLSAGEQSGRADGGAGVAPAG